MDRLLTPYNCVFVLVDYQTRFASSVTSVDVKTLIKNAVDLAKTAKILNIPTILTTLGSAAIGGPILPQLQEIFADGAPIDRANLSLFRDSNILSAVEKIGRKRFVIAGLWTEFCIAPSVIQAVTLGYQVNLVVDACGDLTASAHSEALRQMVEAGTVPMTWLQVYLELERSILHREAYDAMLRIAREHAAAYGLDLMLPMETTQSKKVRETPANILSWPIGPNPNGLIPNKEWLS